MQIRFANTGGLKHLKISFGDGNNTKMERIAVARLTGPLVALKTTAAARFHLAGRLDITHGGGAQSVQLRLEDRPA